MAMGMQEALALIDVLAPKKPGAEGGKTLVARRRKAGDKRKKVVR